MNRPRAFLVLPVVLSAMFATIAARADDSTPAAKAEGSAPFPPPQSAPAAETTSHGHSFVELTTLRLMHEKGVISDAEYESAKRDIADSTGSHAGDSNTVVVGKFATTIYGFVEADSIYDSTQSFNDTQGNAQVAKGGTTAGDHDRFQMSIRNSRFGIRSKAPEYHDIRASAVLEMDFLGTQLPVGQSSSTTPYFGTEQAFFSNPTFRARHVYLKLENPYVDVLFGQTWELFGWQSQYHPNTVEIQGVPGQLYSRTVQLRASKTVKTDLFTFEAAVAGMRPPQRDSAVPEGQAGIRVAFNKWTGVQTNGAASTQIAPLSVAVTGDAKQVRLPVLSATPGDEVKQKVSTAIAIDGFLPVIPGEKGKMGNSLAFNGEFVTGYGIADLYTGLGGVGTAYPAPPNPAGTTPAPVYTPDIDPGIVQYDAGGNLHFIQWTSWLVGAQYYLPALEGRVWVSGNYSHMTSNNIANFGAAAKTRSDLEWFDVNLFGDITPAVRVGAEFANTRDTYQDGTHASNQRVQLSAFYLF